MPLDAASPQTNILVISDGKHGPGATQLISFGQPFSTSDGEAPVSISFETDQLDAAEIGRVLAQRSCDLLILSRCTSKQGVEWIAQGRSAGIPVIFHIDDDLLAVPESLGETKYKAYNNPERLKALRENVERCDLVYASTPELARRLKEHGIRTPILAGDIYCSVSSNEIGALLAPATGPVVGYMGTGGHSADFSMIMPAMIAVMDAVPDLQFELFGTIEMPGQLAHYGRRVRHLPGIKNYSEFIPSLRSLGWWIGLAPLEDNPFNRCKADTKWVEYSLAGIAVVASNMPVYSRACANGAGILASSNSDWVNALLSLLHRPQLRSAMTEAAQEKLRESYTHECLRRQVLTVFETARQQAGRIPDQAATIRGARSR